MISKIENLFLFWILLLIPIVSLIANSTETYKDIPISDKPQLLTESERIHLTNTIDSIKSEQDIVWNILIIDSLQNTSIENFTINIGKTLQKNKKGNRIVFTLTKKERKIYLSTSSSLKGKIWQNEIETIAKSVSSKYLTNKKYFVGIQNVISLTQIELNKNRFWLNFFNNALFITIGLGLILSVVFLRSKFSKKKPRNNGLWIDNNYSNNPNSFGDNGGGSDY